MGEANDLDPKKWREYEAEGLQFFSVWDTPERDPYGWSIESIHGNCPVEIPRQCIFRFSKEGEVVLDPFVGGGTTLVACARMKRRGIGVEINPKIAEIARKNISQQSLEPDVNEWIGKQKVIVGDARNLKEANIDNESVDLVFAHPPYWNLINFSQEYGEVKGDLSTVDPLDEYLDGMKKALNEMKRVLKPGRFCCVLIGETFGKGGEVIPLDYHLTDIALNKVGFNFYSKVIKYTRLATSRIGFINTMKYRSLRSNFFICIHDYVLIFRNPKVENR